MRRQNKKEYYTPQELADLLSVNVMTIYRYIKAKNLNAYKLGKGYRIGKADFDAFLKRASIKP